MKKIIKLLLLKNNYPLIILLFITLLFFYRFFIYNEIYLPEDVLKKYFPWRYQAGFTEKVSSLKELHIPDRDFKDPVIIYYPQDNLYSEMLKEGKLALWNPCNFCGHPLMAEGRPAMLYPLKLILFYFFSTGRAYTLLIIISHFLMGMGMFFYLRNLKLSPVSSLWGAILWMYNGYITVNIVYSTHIQVGALLAFNLLFIDLFIKNPWNRRNFFLLAFFLGMTWLSGHLQYIFYVMLFSFIYFLFRFFISLKTFHKKRNSGKIFLLFLLIFLLSLMTGAGQLIPSFQLLWESERPDMQFNQYKFLLPSNLLNFIFPCATGDVRGNFYFSPQESGVHNHTETSLFIGIVAFHFLLIAFLLPGWKKEKIFFSIFIILPLLILYKIPPFNLIFYLPVFSKLNPFRYIYILHFAAPVITALGVEGLLLNEKKKKIYIFLFIMTMIFLFIIFGINKAFTHISINIEDIMKEYMKIHNVYKGDVEFIAEKILENYSIDNPFFLIPIINWCFCIIFLICFNKSESKKKNIFLYILLLLFTGELLYNGFHKQFTVKETNLYGKTGFTDYLIKNNKYGRVSSFDHINSLPPPDTLMFYSIMDVAGYASIYPGRYSKFMEAMNNESFYYIRPLIDRPENYSRGIEKILGIKYYFNYEGENFLLKEKYPCDYETVFNSEKLEIIENKKALPLFFTAGNYRVITDEGEILKFIFSNSFKPQEEVILEEKITELPEKREGFRKDTVKIAKYLPGDIEIEIYPEDENPFLFFISDTYYPGWYASVNGKEVPLYRANYLFRAIPVVPEKKEKQKIILRFFPLCYKISIFITIISFIGILAVIFFPEVKSEKKKTLSHLLFIL